MILYDIKGEEMMRGMYRYMRGGDKRSLCGVVGVPTDSNQK